MSRFTIHEKEEIAEQARENGGFETQIDWGIDAHELNSLMNDQGLIPCYICGGYFEPSMIAYDYITETSTGHCLDCHKE